MQSRRLVVIDGYSLLYRAFFATRYLSTSDGRPTNALFGFVGMLFLLLEKEKPNAIVVALDAPGKTFRHAVYDGYKGTRKETQDELRVQLKEARHLIESLGIPSVEVVGFEADDVVGTISKKAEENGYDTLIVTGDLDSLQLVDNCVSVLTPGKGMSETQKYDEAAVVERYGFGPEHIPDYKSLKGDTSDNIPGVPGIGDKGAAELIQKFGTIEQMLDQFDQVPEKYRKKMEGQQDQMRQSKHLATIVRDVELTYDFRPFVLTEEQMQTAVKLMENLEFRQHAKRAPKVLGPYMENHVPPEPGDAPAPTEVVAIEVQSREAADYADLRKFAEGRVFAVYFGAPPARKNLFDEETDRPAFVAIGREVVRCRESDAVQLVGEFARFAVLHDAKLPFRKIVKAAREAGRLEAVLPPLFDTFLAAYVLRSERTTYPLLDLASGYLDAVPSTPEEMSAAIYLLHAPLRERLEKEDQLRVLEDIELPLVPILADMENLGICADRSQLRAFSQELQITIEKTQVKIFELAGSEFTIGSPKQLGEVLFDKLKIPGATKTKTGYATGVEILEPLSAEYEIAREILTWRELSKLKSTYADSLEKIIQADGRIHTTYNQTVAATGRLSSIDPNLQNIPIRTELGRGIRKAFDAQAGYVLAAFDYSQIELRILAHMCGETALVEAFKNHIDVHTVTAQLMFNLDQEPPTKEQRRLAKMLNYAVLYGVTDFGLQAQLGSGFSRSEAKALIQLYNERFPTVKEFTKAVVVEARSKGFTVTLRGRRRYFPDIHASRMQDRQYAERQAMNAPIQGTAADMIKLAMLKVHPLLEKSQTRMLLNVHDELVFELKKGDEALIPEIKQIMEEALPLTVPVEVDAKVGQNWNDMTPV